VQKVSQPGCLSCCPTNVVKALKEITEIYSEDTSDSLEETSMQKITADTNESHPPVIF